MAEYLSFIRGSNFIVSNSPTPKQLTHALGAANRLSRLINVNCLDALRVYNLTIRSALPQPKISRHFVILREIVVIQEHRAGLWTHYTIRVDLPVWVLDSFGILAVKECCSPAGIRHQCLFVELKYDFPLLQ